MLSPNTRSNLFTKLSIAFDFIDLKLENYISASLEKAIQKKKNISVNLKP